MAWWTKAVAFHAWQPELNPGGHKKKPDVIPELLHQRGRQGQENLPEAAGQITQSLQHGRDVDPCCNDRCGRREPAPKSCYLTSDVRLGTHLPPATQE